VNKRQHRWLSVQQPPSPPPLKKRLFKISASIEHICRTKFCLELSIFHPAFYSAASDLEASYCDSFVLFLFYEYLFNLVFVVNFLSIFYQPKDFIYLHCQEYLFKNALQNIFCRLIFNFFYRSRPFPHLQCHA